jgi:hypothetical protein
MGLDWGSDWREIGSPGLGRRIEGSRRDWCAFVFVAGGQTGEGVTLEGRVTLVDEGGKLCGE